jgi:hypothetical protein
MPREKHRTKGRELLALIGRDRARLRPGMVTRRYGFRARLTAAVTSGAFLASFSVPALAAGPDPVAAQALFDLAKELITHGRANEACPMLEESQRLDPASGTLINLADCYEQQGRTATAWSTFLEAAAAARVAGNLARERAARQRAGDLAPLLSKIVIDVAAKDTPGLEIRRDGSLVGHAQWGAPIPLDKGEHRVSASAPDRRPWEKVVFVKDAGATEIVSVPELEKQSQERSVLPASPRARHSRCSRNPKVTTPVPIVEIRRAGTRAAWNSRQTRWLMEMWLRSRSSQARRRWWEAQCCG